MLVAIYQHQVLQQHNDTTQDIYHLQRGMRLTEPKRKAAHDKPDQSAEPFLTPKVSVEKQECLQDPASFMKYGEVTAPIHKSPDKTLF